MAACGGTSGASPETMPVADGGLPDPVADAQATFPRADAETDAPADADAGSANALQPTVACGPKGSARFAFTAEQLDVPSGFVLGCEALDPPIEAVRAGYRGYRVAYRSAVLLHEGGLEREQPVALTGQIYLPNDNDSTTATPRSVLLLTHGATGLLERCAPSLTGSNFDASLLFGTLAGVFRGAVFVVPDFLGLGVDSGIRAPDADVDVADPLNPFATIRPTRDISHSYVSIESEGRSAIDLVRALQAIPNAGVAARPPWVALGVSQGGHAALAAGEVWSRGYGRADTELRGVMAGAPGALLEDRRFIQNEVEWLLIPMVLAGLSLEYRDFRASTFLSKQAFGSLGKTAGKQCLSLGSIGGWLSYVNPLAPLLQVDPLTDPAAKQALHASSPGFAFTEAPIFIGQVSGDPFVDPRRTELLVALERGTNPGRVTSCTYPGEHLDATSWTERANNHNAFQWMFGSGPSSCSLDGDPMQTSALAFLRARLGL